MEKIRMLSTLGLMGAMRSLSSAFESATGIHVDADFAPTLALLKRLRDGEAADLLILTREGLDEMIGEGRVVAGGAADLARSYVGIAVRAGQAHPDISSEAALRRLFAARRERDLFRRVDPALGHRGRDQRHSHHRAAGFHGRAARQR